MGILRPIFKPVSAACNLRCRYCFYKNSHPQNIPLMTTSTLERAIFQLIEASPEGLHFYWHGGEPLLAGLDFYRKAVEIEKQFCPPNYHIENSIQTNGTLLTQEWVDFFKEHCFGVGISLDGPEEIHDKGRVTLSGQGSFRLVMKAVELLKKNDMKTSCLAVVTKNSLGKAREIFEFFYRNEIFQLDFSPCFNQDEFGISPVEYTDFMIEMFDIFMDVDDPRVKIRSFNSTLYLLLGGSALSCFMVNQRDCGLFPTIDWNGDIYFCDNYEGSSQFCLGNLLNQETRLLLKSAVYKQIQRKIRKIQAKLGCFKCEISKICGGGCPRHWFWRGDYTLQCAARRKLVYHIMGRITSLLNQVESATQPAPGTTCLPETAKAGNG